MQHAPFLASALSLFLACVSARAEAGTDVSRASSAASGPSSTAHPLSGSIKPDAIKAHMTFLADDLLEGREAGTRGYDLAANYVATQYALLGLQPAGTGNSYFQYVPLKSSRLVPDSVRATIQSKSGTHSFTNVNGIAVYSNPLEADQSLEAPVVFVGYGIVAPELRIDDYKGLDVKGKLVAVIGGPPLFMASEAAAHHGSTSQRRKVASDHGAIGVLFLWTQVLEKQFAFERLKQVVNEVDVAWIAPDGTVNVPAPGIRASVLVHLDAAKYLFEGAPRSLQRVLQESRRTSPRGFPLAATFSLSRQSAHNIVTSANVAALLPGSDPALANEIVLLTGHLDHVGLDPSLNGDKIHNGALDNSIGISMMLEVARALTTAPSKPKRSVMFLAVTAEEKGLIGSDYFAHFPTVPMNRIIANVNLDGALPFYDFTDVIAFGAEHSTLGDIVAGAVQSAGLAQSPDPFPEEGFFVRSDHYSLVKQGVPAVMLFMGMGKGADGKSGREAWDWFKRDHLHRPSDDLKLPINYDVAAKFASVYQLITQRVADSPEAPRWYAGDNFGERFAPQAPKATRKSGASQ